MRFAYMCMCMWAHSFVGKGLEWLRRSALAQLAALRRYLRLLRRPSAAACSRPEAARWHDRGGGRAVAADRPRGRFEPDVRFVCGDVQTARGARDRRRLAKRTPAARAVTPIRYTQDKGMHLLRGRKS